MPDTTHPHPDRILGCLLGGAIGDALGAPVERLSLGDIHRRYGRDGIRGYVGRPGSRGAITAGTQLTLFTAHALVQSSVRARARGIGGAATGILQATYLTWLNGQSRETTPQPFRLGGWLAAEPAMTERRKPPRSCLSALDRAAARRDPGRPLGTPEQPVNDSKGCGAVVRTAPCGFGTSSPEAAFELGCRAAALTHGHPSGHLPAGVLAATVWGLVRGRPLTTALEDACELLRRRDGHEETATAIEAAVDLAAQGPSTPERVESLGGGWTGEQALAGALYVVLRAEDDVPELPEGGWHPDPRPVRVATHALLRSVNHSGDSDSVGSITGNLLGARYGGQVFPGHWQAGLEVRHAVVQMAADCALEFGMSPPTEPDGYGTPAMDWLLRYPEA
ncbi:ADP-ribosylglycohydrolase family protein [Thermomonospora amylolytica]|uniref:ADP-ribosylglycohydrolase family protein n=1 Tax=Thermomonospora amylolytica TaxID=1411117 RepID=UPI000E6B8E98|nr:ADP-ribosylglycohydrolase family protein [Thermomonospora amylolytica]